MSSVETINKLQGTEDDQLCHSCGGTIKKNFCPQCGEKRLSTHDFSLKHYLEESFEGFTHFDNKFFKTIKVLVSRPGALSDSFFKGNRVQFMRPFHLFLVCNLIFTCS